MSASVSAHAHPVEIPPRAVAVLRRSLPAAVAPMPASGAYKISPVVSERLPSPDRTFTVVIGAEPFAMTALSKDGKLAALSVPIQRNGAKSYTNRWFKAEDVFGGVKWDVRRYRARQQNLLYFARGRGPVELVARLPKDGECISLGRAVADKTDWPLLVHPSPGFVCGATANESRIVLAREAPPVATKAEYDKRVAELLAEYAFREGRPWGTGFRPLLSWHPKHRRYACAAFANDFAMYVFGKMYWHGEPFGAAKDIRAGDYIRMDGGHKFIVLYREGTVLHTIEGNYNKVVSRSTKRYSVRDGRLFKNGKERGITQAFHLWPSR